MPKVKTRKNAAKRFKVTGTGRIVRESSNKAHKNMKKRGGRYRRLSQDHVLEGDGQMKNARKMLLVGVSQ